MSTRRRFVAAIGAGGLVAAARSFGQQSASRQVLPRRIGYLVLQSMRESPSRERQAFLDGLRDLGYAQGKDIEIVYASSEGEEDFLPHACADLIRKNVELIVLSGAQAAVAAKASTRSVPLVLMAVGDPVGIGLVKSLARPGGNITGVSFISTDLAGKRVQLLKELIPRARRLALLWNARNANALTERNEASAVARTLGFAVQDIPVNASGDLGAFLASLERGAHDAIYVTFEGGLIASRRSDIAQASLRQRIPVVSGWTFMTEAGGLFSYAPDIPAIFYRSAHYVHRILQGQAPAELPIEMPTKVEFVINGQTARLMEIPIPAAILLRADRVIA